MPPMVRFARSRAQCPGVGNSRGCYGAGWLRHTTMPAPKRYSAAITVEGKSIYLGRWPTRKAAAIAKARARLFFRQEPQGRYAAEAQSLGAASPDVLLREARFLRKARFTSRFEGVLWNRRAGRWMASITIRRRNAFIGW